MKSRAEKRPKNFSWKITKRPKRQLFGKIVFQEQCSCGVITRHNIRNGVANEKQLLRHIFY